MRISKTEKKTRPRHGEPMILFNVGPVTFAIAANAVDEIRNLDGLAPLKSGYLHTKLSKFKYTLERDERTYFVVDANLHFHMLPSRATRLLVLRGAQAAVLVDSIDRMAEVAVLHALPRAFQGEEQHWYRGVAVIKDKVIPVVNPDAFLSKAEFTVLRAASPYVVQGASA